MSFEGGATNQLFFGKPATYPLSLYTAPFPSPYYHITVEKIKIRTFYHTIMADALLTSVVHWRKKIEKHTDEETILNVIRKLSKVPITLEILEATHIGRCIRKLSKQQDTVGEKALALLKKWRGAFAISDSSNSKNSSKSSSSDKSKKENVNKESSRSSAQTDIRCEKPKTERKTSLTYSENKHKNKSVSQNHTQHSSKYTNGEYGLDISEQSSPSFYSYEKNRLVKGEDYDLHSDFNEGYDPDCPEVYHGSTQKSAKQKPLDSSTDIYKPSTIKRKRSMDEEIDTKTKFKKHKSSSHSRVDSTSETRQTSSKNEKHTSSQKHRSPDCSKVESRDKLRHKSSDLKKSKKMPSEKSNSSKSKKEKLKINCSEEFTSSEVRFEDCLGLNDIVMKKTKKALSASSNKKTISNSNKTSAISSSHVKEKSSKRTDKSVKEKSLFEVPKSAVHVDEVDIMSTLPEIQPNYRPLPPRNLDFPSKKKVLSNEEAIKFMSSRKEKTAVYSGKKTYYTEVPSLFECCTRILIENIDAIEYMGGVPYFLLKPVLERCTPEQLFAIEHYNPYLLEDTHELWENHCKRDYRLLTPQESETWRELYLRAQEERERKLRSITANISASMSKSNPVRQVKLAYVDSVAKPPRDVARRQAKHGTGLPVSHVLKTGPPSKATPTPTAPVINSTLSSRAATSIIPKSKPKVAPLMAKTLKSMKLCFRR